MSEFSERLVVVRDMIDGALSEGDLSDAEVRRLLLQMLIDELADLEELLDD